MTSLAPVCPLRSYVPDGLDPKKFEALKKKEGAKKAQNKQKFKFVKDPEVANARGTLATELLASPLLSFL